MKIKQKITSIREKRKTSYKKIKAAFVGTERGFQISSQLFVCILLGASGSSLTKVEWVGFLLGAVLAIPIGILGTKLAGWMLRPILKCNGRSFAYALLNVTVLVSLSIGCSVGADEGEAAIVAVVMFLTATFFAKSLWAVFAGKVYKLWMIALLVITGGLTGASVWFLTIDGFEDSYVSEYRKWNKAAKEIPGFDTYGELGNYTVEALEYSPYKEVELKTEPVDLSDFVMEEETWHQAYREAFQSYGLENAPVAGKVWYPAEMQNCPVIFMAHGNHSITEESYLGYEYLGTYLASHGYVFVSVDENLLNERSGENDGRAVLLLENIKALQEFNEQEGNLLYQKMDYDNIALAGHSRGGEMIAAAYLFNDCETYPSNGMFSFDYHFSIKALLAVAPSVNQYQPADHEVELSDVNYLVVQGANDQDISVFMGNEQYENISFSGEGDYLKASLYIAGANHGQFNSLWGKYDMEPPFSWWLNVENFISEEEQQYLLKVFARAFFDNTLKGEREYEDLLTAVLEYESYLPETLYVQQYEQSGFSLLADFEEDSDLTTASDDSILLAEHMSMWTEEKISDSKEGIGERENHALRLKWKNTEEACYEITPEHLISLEGAEIQFDVCNLATIKDSEVSTEEREEKSKVSDVPTEETEQTFNSSEVLTGETEQALNFSVVLTDETGKQVSGKVGDYSTLYPAFPVTLSKVQYLFGDSEEKYQFQTVKIPADELKGETDFDITKVRSVRLVFEDSDHGELWLDNIGIVRNK